MLGVSYRNHEINECNCNVYAIATSQCLRRTSGVIIVNRHASQAVVFRPCLPPPKTIIPGTMNGRRRKRRLRGIIEERHQGVDWSVTLVVAAHRDEKKADGQLSQQRRLSGTPITPERHGNFFKASLLQFTLTFYSPQSFQCSCHVSISLLRPNSAYLLSAAGLLGHTKEGSYQVIFPEGERLGWPTCVRGKT